MMSRQLLGLLVCVGLLGCQQSPDATAAPASERAAAVEFADGLPWLNVSEPLSLEKLRGKVVLLDFWTYGCVNCMHVIPDLQRLQAKYGNKLAVIAVHSPKFENEKNFNTLRNIVVRYGIEHPVVNDVDFSQWRSYGIRAWPTQVVIDPAGGAVTSVSGEGNYDRLDKVIGDLVAEFEGRLDESPLPVSLEKDRLKDSTLAAPGKIEVTDRWVAISDTLHHRILFADHDGKVQHIFGGPEKGYVDGSKAEARFNQPQGVVFDGDNTVYVADTGNHTIRRIDLDQGTVETAAGTGKNEFYLGGEKPARSLGLRSPWDLALRDGQLYVAMAGSHQIWKMDLERDVIGPWAGSGRESIIDGPVATSAFSQPSGLDIEGDWLYVADSEDSAVRRIHLSEERVETLVGTGLFDFGDRNGSFDQALLQHVLGVAVIDGERIAVADTYNHQLKELHLGERQVSTLAGTGQPEGGAGALNEPGGLSYWNGKLYVADTNNDRVMVLDLDGGTFAVWPVWLK